MTTRLDPTPLQVSVTPRPAARSLPSGRELVFTDAVLSIRNGGDRPLPGLVPLLSVRQDETTLGEESDVLLAKWPAGGLAPGEEVEWGLYDLLQAVDRGFASKIHLFGLKAALNWSFHLEVKASWRGGSESSQAPVFRAAFRWRVVEGAPGGIGLEVGA